MAPRNPRPAFTLLELVLVVAVIGIFAALSAPSIQGMYGSYKLTAATDQLRAAWPSRSEGGTCNAIPAHQPPFRPVAPGSARLADDLPPVAGGADSTRLLRQRPGPRSPVPQRSDRAGPVQARRGLRRGRAPV